MRVLVTGGAGYMGSVLCRQLLQQGHHVRVLDSLMHGGQAILPLYSDDNFSFIRGDVRDSAAVKEALDQIDGVVHLAAIVGDPACAREPELAREVNQEAALEVYSLAQNSGVERFVFASTCSNYGRMSDPTQYLDEESELRPVSLYAETLGEWTRPLIGASAFLVMFSTTFTVVDGFPRALAVLADRFRGPEVPEEATGEGDRRVYWGGTAVLFGGSLLVLHFALSSLGAMVDLATTLSFLTAPLLSLLTDPQRAKCVP